MKLGEINPQQKALHALVLKWARNNNLTYTTNTERNTWTSASSQPDFDTQTVNIIIPCKSKHVRNQLHDAIQDHPLFDTREQYKQYTYITNAHHPYGEIGHITHSNDQLRITIHYKVDQQ